MDIGIQKIDLTNITRDPDKVRCTIDIEHDYEQFEWIVAGSICILNEGNFCRIHARMNCTDFEHDSAYAFRLPLIGLKYKYTTEHTSFYEAWINPQSDGEPYPDFHVPRPGYDPRTVEETITCSQCEEPHLIIPEAYYLPPFDPELFKLVAGRKVYIRIGPNWSAIKQDE